MILSGTMKYATLSSPFELDGLTLSNRIVMPPLVIWKAGRDGRVTDAHMAHYRASRGPGLVVVEATCVSPEGRLAASQLGLWDDSQIEGMARLSELLRDAGAVAGIQIHHAGSKATRDKTYGLTPACPSVPVESNPEAEELSEADIRLLVRRFADAADRAVLAGFQVLEIHGAHGYLISQFLSPRSNHRTDRYGGDIEGRSRFLREVAEAMRQRVGGRAVLSCRLGLAEGGQGGLSVEDGLAAARMLEEIGLKLIHISHGGTTPDAGTPGDSRFSVTLDLARRAREALSIPVIGVGGIRTGDDAESALVQGFADLIAVGKGILADPGWTRKVLSGQEEEISLCRTCEPRCFHFTEPARCPARRKRGIDQAAGRPE